MKKEYELKSLKKRKGKVKVDKDVAKIPISLRIDGSVLAGLKDEAGRLGLPYQTFISSILFQYYNGELVSKKTVKILEDLKAS
jgi:predicted DNA binding CopG/RHH family protein